MAATIYLLCALTAFACSWMLLSNYFQRRHRLLLWSGLCFAGLFLNNLFLVLDELFFLDVDFSTWRLVVVLSALLLLLYGLIWEEE